jgi:hypothetical protein
MKRNRARTNTLEVCLLVGDTPYELEALPDAPSVHRLYFNFAAL